MKKNLHIIIGLLILLLNACDVHEWPDSPEFVRCQLRLTYETEMTEWRHLYDGVEVVEQGYGEIYDNHQNHGKIRYIVRTYPVSGGKRIKYGYIQEFVFVKDISEGYDHEVVLDLLPGDYYIQVWSDLVESAGDSHPYNAESFASVEFQGIRRGNSDYCDAFCGQDSISLTLNAAKQISRTINVCMKRPMAKIEVVANDLSEFTKMKGGDLSRYEAKIHYVGFVPSVYNLFVHRPVASNAGGVFESSLKKLTDSEVSMGFDYVFVSDMGTMVTVRVGIYDQKNQLVSLSGPITIPIKPDHHTLLMGNFLMQTTSNGVDIDPNWGGDYNITL
jgi:hypothetical protein